MGGAVNGHFDFKDWDGSTKAILDHYEADEKIIGDLRDEAVHHAEWGAIQLMQIVDSPIERRLLLALVSPRDIRDENQIMLPGRVKVIAPRAGLVAGFTEVNFVGYEDNNSALLIELQKPVGKYRADFVLTWSGTDCHDTTIIDASASLCVEADGHDFHQKTKQQAAHDKKRDRFFTQQGLTVVRFTGSEIHKSAIRCASEARRLLCVRFSQAMEQAFMRSVAEAKPK